MSTIELLGPVRFHGMLPDKKDPTTESKNVSGVAFWNQRALVVADEISVQGNVVQAFEQDGADYRALRTGVTVLDGPGEPVHEMDLEGIAVQGQTVFVLGSHAAKRKKTDGDKEYKKNRKALMSVPEAQASRDVLIRFDLDALGKAGPIKQTSLRDYLNATEPFQSFSSIASKENGVDAEGLAVRNDKLYVGFRGPVLRGNFTPILRCRFGTPIGEPELLFVNLGGRGVRDLADVTDGILILAGPVGDGPGTYQLYLWDGRDGVPGTGAPTSTIDTGLRLLGEFPTPSVPAGAHEIIAKPEGLAVIGETNHQWDILLVYDGLADGHAARFRVKKS